MEIKALIFCGGNQGRHSPVAHTRPRHLLPILNKPAIYYVIESILRAGIREIGVVTPETEEELRHDLGDGSRWDIALTHILQPAPPHPAHPIRIGRDFLKNAPFLIHPGDTLIKTNLADLIEKFRRLTPEALLLLQRVETPGNFDVAELDTEGRLIALEAKPDTPHSDLAMVGVSLFGPGIHAAIDRLAPTDDAREGTIRAIRHLLDTDAGVCADILDGWWLDIAGKDSLLEANRTLLDELPEEHQDIAPDVQISSGSRVTGAVRIAPGTTIQNCIIRGPAVLGANCELEDVYVGPYTVIGNTARIVGSEIENTVVLDGARILRLGDRIENSLIGYNARIIRRESPGVIRLILGDNSQVDIL